MFYRRLRLRYSKGTKEVKHFQSSGFFWRKVVCFIFLQPIPNSLDPKFSGNNFQPLAYLIVVIYKSSHYCYSFPRTVVSCRKSMFLKQKAKAPLKEWYFRFIPWGSTTTDIFHSIFSNAMRPHGWLLRRLTATLTKTDGILTTSSWYSSVHLLCSRDLL